MSKAASGQLGPKLRLTVREITKERAVSFIRQYHYSKVMPRLNKYHLGFSWITAFAVW